MPTDPFYFIFSSPHFHFLLPLSYAKHCFIHFPTLFICRLTFSAILNYGGRDNYIPMYILKQNICSNYYLVSLQINGPIFKIQNMNHSSCHMKIVNMDIS